MKRYKSIIFGVFFVLLYILILIFPVQGLYVFFNYPIEILFQTGFFDILPHNPYLLLIVQILLIFVYGVVLFTVLNVKKTNTKIALAFAAIPFVTFMFASKTPLGYLVAQVYHYFIFGLPTLVITDERRVIFDMTSPVDTIVYPTVLWFILAYISVSIFLFLKSKQNNSLRK